VSSVSVLQREVYEANGEQYDTLYEALEALYCDGTATRYKFHYTRNGEGHRDTCATFQDLITTAYHNPQDFVMGIAYPPLTPTQREFLDNVLEVAMAEREVKA
jgi:hypothetical protein